MRMRFMPLQPARVDLQYYASLNMDAIIPLTEAVGGVPVTLEQDMKGIGKAGETVVLHGETAYQFVRRRKGITGGSDVARTARQRDYLKGLAMRVKEMGAVAAVPSLLGRWETTPGPISAWSRCWRWPPSSPGWRTTP